MKEGSVFVTKKREKESNIGYFRIKKGFKVTDLCKICELHIGVYAALQNGMDSPIYLAGKRAGTVKPYVQRVLSFLGCTLAQAFPRYVCDVPKAITIELLDDQALEITVSEYSSGSDRCRFFEDEALREELKILFGKLTVRQEMVIACRFFEEESLEVIGNRLNITRERVRQIEAKALQALRGFFYNEHKKASKYKKIPILMSMISKKGERHVYIGRD